MRMRNHMIQALDKPISLKSLQNCFDFVDYFTPTASHPKLIRHTSSQRFQLSPPQNQNQNYRQLQIVNYRSITDPLLPRHRVRSSFAEAVVTSLGMIFTADILYEIKYTNLGFYQRRLYTQPFGSNALFSARTLSEQEIKAYWKTLVQRRIDPADGIAYT